MWGKYYGQWLMEACLFTYDFDRFHPAEILDLIDKYQITTLCCPPTMYRLMMQEDFERFDLSSLEYSTTAGGAQSRPLRLLEGQYRPHDLRGLRTDRDAAHLCEPYSFGSASRLDGRPNPLYELEIKRDDGSRCDVGETGEICIKMDPRPEGIMMEYYRNPEKPTMPSTMAGITR